MTSTKKCISKEAEFELKPYELANLLKTELNLDDDENYNQDMKPKEIVALANQKLGIEGLGGDASVKEEACHSRSAVRSLPASFWTTLQARNGSSLDDLVERLLAKPASAGGFTCGMAAKIISPKNIDTKTIVSAGGATTIGGFTILRPLGAYATLDHELSCLFKLFRSAGTGEKLGDCSFSVQERTQPYKGQVCMTANATKCNARFIGLLTPKWILVGVYEHVVSVEAEAAIVQLFENMRLEIVAK